MEQLIIMKITADELDEKVLSKHFNNLADELGAMVETFELNEIGTEKVNAILSE